MQYLTRHGYTLLTSYQPGSRFWPFQWIEGGWLLALSVLVIAASVWLVHRRLGLAAGRSACHLRLRPGGYQRRDRLVRGQKRCRVWQNRPSPFVKASTLAGFTP